MAAITPEEAFRQWEEGQIGYKGPRTTKYVTTDEAPAIEHGQLFTSGDPALPVWLIQDFNEPAPIKSALEELKADMRKALEAQPSEGAQSTVTLGEFFKEVTGQEPPTELIAPTEPVKPIITFKKKKKLLKAKPTKKAKAKAKKKAVKEIKANADVL